MNDAMELETMLASVRNDVVEYVTGRPPGSRFPTLDRRVVVTGPESLVRLVAAGEVRVLDELISMLDVRERAWAAEVLLAAMTGHESDIVNSFSTEPDAWWDTMGGSAPRRWKNWLEMVRGRLVWNPEARLFTLGDEDKA